mmetsp:Transcript_29874/g.96416  ORF Transcript_29874/g.96416 Transcript_29874/m.96416 type:complete len:239 (-) Transcript_29874:24-740(-)
MQRRGHHTVLGHASHFPSSQQPAIASRLHEGHSEDERSPRALHFAQPELPRARWRGGQRNGRVGVAGLRDTDGGETSARGAVQVDVLARLVVLGDCGDAVTFRQLVDSMALRLGHGLQGEARLAALHECVERRFERQDEGAILPCKRDRLGREDAGREGRAAPAARTAAKGLSHRATAGGCGAVSWRRRHHHQRCHRLNDHWAPAPRGRAGRRRGRQSGESLGRLGVGGHTIAGVARE